MNKDLFTPVNYDEQFPTAVPAAPAPVVEEPMTPERVVEAINAELQKIQLGTSKMTPHAVQVREGATPFLHMLKTFALQPTVDTALALVSVAKQDFGTTFGRFVEALVSSLFKEKK